MPTVLVVRNDATAYMPLDYAAAAGPPFLGNPAQHSAMRLFLPTPLCGSWPAKPHFCKAA
jgi:hypothetical protein